MVLQPPTWAHKVLVISPLVVDVAAYLGTQQPREKDKVSAVCRVLCAAWRGFGVVDDSGGHRQVLCRRVAAAVQAAFVHEEGGVTDTRVVPSLDLFPEEFIFARPLPIQKAWAMVASESDNEVAAAVLLPSFVQPWGTRWRYDQGLGPAAHRSKDRQRM